METVDSSEKIANTAMSTWTQTLNDMFMTVLVNCGHRIQWASPVSRKSVIEQRALALGIFVRLSK